MPAMPDGVRDGILRGIYKYKSGHGGSRRRVALLGSGAILQQVLRAQELLADKYDVSADVWSVTSYQLLRNEALEAERWNRLHPEAEPRVPYVTQVLRDPAPVIAPTDFLNSVPDHIGPCT